MAKGKKTGGRQKGSKNKRGTIKEAVLMAYDYIGGDDAFGAWAKANPSDFYNKIFAKLIPHELAAAVGDGVEPLRIEVTRSASTSDAK